MIICSPSMSIEGRISIGNFLLQTIVACKSWDTHTFLSHRIFGKYFIFLGIFNSNFSQSGIFNSNFSQSGVLVVPLTRQAATQGSKQFEVNNCQQALIFCQYPFRYFIPDLFENLCPSETEDKKVLSRSVKGTCQRGPSRHRHSYWWGGCRDVDCF